MGRINVTYSIFEELQSSNKDLSLFTSPLLLLLVCLAALLAVSLLAWCVPLFAVLLPNFAPKPCSGNLCLEICLLTLAPLLVHLFWLPLAAAGPFACQPKP